MQIVILDAFTVDQGELTWDELNKLGQVTRYERTKPEQVLERCKGAEVVLTNKVQLSADLLNQMPRLLYVGVLATGYNVVNLQQAEKQNVIVTNIPAYSTDSVAQMVFAHLLNIVNRVEQYALMNRQGHWNKSEDFMYLNHRLHELAGKTIGVVGLGNIGSAVAKIALAFNMKVLALTSKNKEQLPQGVQSVKMEELLMNADVITLNCPLNEKTHHFINAQTISKMKSSAVLINTGRGPLVNDHDLAEALNDGKIAAYAADVITCEPPKDGNPLLTAKNAFFTPHIAWATVEARQRLMNIATDNVKAFIKGHPVNVVNQ